MRHWLPITVLAMSVHATAFNDRTHQAIIHDAFEYLNTHAHRSAATDRWLAAKDQLEQALTVGIVNVDFRDNLWFDAWYRASFSGGQSGSHVGMLTSLYHFLNVTKPGQYWKYDGYAYRNTDGSGNDGYMGTVGMIVRGDLSPPLRDMQAYRAGFKGSKLDWQRLYFDNAPLSATVMPPANVPAQIAYDRVLSSDRADHDRTQSQEVDFKVAHDYLFSGHYKREVESHKIRGLPTAIDELAFTIHITQDLAVPHHAQGLAGHCHVEFESEVDRLGELYDPQIVAQFLTTSPALDSHTTWNMSERLIEIAKISAAWRFEPYECEKQLSSPATVLRIQSQFNLAVASTVWFLEKIALDYENAHRAVYADESVNGVCVSGSFWLMPRPRKGDY